MGAVPAFKIRAPQTICPEIVRKTDVLKPMPIVFGRIAVYARRPPFGASHCAIISRDGKFLMRQNEPAQSFFGKSGQTAPPRAASRSGFFGSAAFFGKKRQKKTVRNERFLKMRGGGIEPPPCKPGPAPQTDASTNSAILA